MTSYGAIAVDLNYMTKWIGSQFNLNLNKSLYHHERVERDFPFNFKYSEKSEAINHQRHFQNFHIQEDASRQCRSSDHLVNDFNKENKIK